MIGKVVVAVLAVGAIFIGSGIYSNSTPEGAARTQARHAIDDCRRQMKDTMLAASTREAARFMCNGLRNDYVRAYGSEP